MVETRGYLDRNLAVIRAALILAGTLCAAPVAFPAIIVDLASYTEQLRIYSLLPTDGLGSGEILSCDVNGNRVPDLVLGVPRADGINASRPSCGETYVVLGRRGRWAGNFSISDLASTRIIGQQELHSWGSGVACADLNNDGFDEIAAGAPASASLNNSRAQAGQVHIIFGSASLPPVIDLAQPFGTIVYGAESPDGIGDELTTGDINGDGTLDLVVDASHATFSPNNQTNAGKLHVLFGRASWPSVIDLRTNSDLTIAGVTKSDNFGFQLATDDLDGTDELIVDAPGSDRPGTTRLFSGSVYIWRGRATWPPFVTLASAQPDTLAYGADAGDQFGRASMHVADWDQDGSPDLVLGGPYADGPTESVSSSGEIRTLEFGASWPAIVDLRTTFSRVLYGIDPDDDWCNRFQVGDVNGDRVPGVTCGAADAGGPGESRWHSGEGATVLGRVGLATDLRLANGDYDLYIYGADQQDSIGVARYGTDINDDGLEEIAIRGNYSVPGRLSDVYLVSPFDIDNDGFSQLADNCPLVHNPDQLDTNADLRGDACALDWDADAINDAADCAANDRQAGTPPDIFPLALTVNALDQAVLTRPLQPSAERYEISRGSIGQLASGSYGQCKTASDPDPSDGQFIDGELPAAGSSYFYLVQGVDTACGGPGSLGKDSAGNERVNLDPERCEN